jgi:hypothetical protein
MQSLSKTSISLAFGLLTAAIITTRPALATINCEITQCRMGGNVPECWQKMRAEALSKSRACKNVQIGSGVSAYAMALSLPRTCIKSTAVIKIHRPFHFRNNYKAVPIGSRWHNYYFGRIRPKAVSYFKARGGMNRDGTSNAFGMTAVPAAQTGAPICK